MSLFFITATLVWGLINGYACQALARSLGEHRRWRAFLYSFFAVTTLSFPATFFAHINGWSSTGPPFWVAYTGFGFVLTLFPVLMTRDFFRLIFEKKTFIFGPPSPFDRSKRRFMGATFSGALVGSAALLTGVGFYTARSDPKIERFDLLLPSLPPDLERFTIVQISDTHIGPTVRRDYVERIVDSINSLDADLLCFTGDLADGYLKDIGDETTPLAQARGRYGRYFVTGNHDYYWEVEQWLGQVRRLGFDLLINEHRTITVGAATLVVGGITDYTAERHEPTHRSDAHKAFAGAPQGDFRLGLCHQPRSVRSLLPYTCHLVMAGHTHGGQFFPWNMVIPLLHPYPTGMSHVGETSVYVSRGTGYWGPPLRTAVPAEITVATLRREGTMA